MSYEPDTNDIRVRQLKEEIAKIREEQFARSFPTNQGGGANVVGGGLGVSAPTTGVTAWLPNVIRIVKDTGVVDRIAYDGKNVNKDFEIGETVTGNSSGATGIVGDIDITGTTTGFIFFVQGSTTGTFTDNENLNGSGAGGNNIADYDDSFGTTAPVGRGHLNAGSASIIVDTRESPAEIHYIDNATNDGQIVLLRAQNGLTIRVRRAQTSDGNTGNLDLDESFDLTENALVFLQFQSASNITPDGGWVPLITDITTGIVGGGGSGITFPILYPKDELGNQGNVTATLDLNQANGHYKRITLTGDVGLAFNLLPPSTNGFKFYLETTQDATGGWVYTSLPASVINGGTLLGQLQTAPLAKTLWQFSTADGGVTWHSQVVQAQGTPALGDNLGDHCATQDLDMKTFDIINTDVYKYANGIVPGSDGIIGIGQYGSTVQNDTTLKWSIPASTLATTRNFEWCYDNVPAMTLQRTSSGQNDLNLYETFIERTTGIQFTHFAPVGTSIIRPQGLETQYINGFATGAGGFHGFRVGGQPFPQFEIREDVIRANRNLDMITNDIVEIDRARFTATGGFGALNDHGDRLISGGNPGVQINIPFGASAKSFSLWFENSAQDNSIKQYEFFSDQLRMNQNIISDTLGIFFSNGASFVDALFNFEINGGTQGTAPNAEPQPMVFKSKELVGFDTYVTRDIFTIDAREFFSGGGMKMQTDLNLQTQDINNIDVLRFAVDSGDIQNDEYAISASVSDTSMNFNVPLGRQYTFHEDGTPIAFLGSTGLFLQSTALFPSPVVSAKEFALNGAHTGGDPSIDGQIRLIDNAGSLDIMVATGGNLVNLSDLAGGGGTSFIGFDADDDLRMNTFNITNVDVLRFGSPSTPGIGSVIGFGEYGISTNQIVGPTSEYMTFSTPNNKGYEFQDNLEQIAFLNSTGLNLVSNSGFSDPALVAHEVFLQNNSLGTGLMFNGSIRRVGTDVFIASGGDIINISDLSGGIGVTEGQDPVNWTGQHTFESASGLTIPSDDVVFGTSLDRVRFNNLRTVFGQTGGETIIITALFDSSLIPDNDNLRDLGVQDGDPPSSRPTAIPFGNFRWRNIRFAGQIRNNNSQMDGITISTPSLNSDDVNFTGNLRQLAIGNPQVGFFGATPVGQQPVIGPSDPENQASINSIIQLLQAYGLA